MWLQEIYEEFFRLFKNSMVTTGGVVLVGGVWTLKDESEEVSVCGGKTIFIMSFEEKKRETFASI